MFDFPQPDATPQLAALRAEVRDFLAVELAGTSQAIRAQSWAGFDADFSRKLGERGWIGMTWPKPYGGGRSQIERYTVIEELLAAGAPVGAHWIADRQGGPLLLRYGSERQRASILPRVASGVCFVAIGMSEPGTGSDLASVQTRAQPTTGGFILNGTKLWSTQAHHCHYMVTLCRTDGGAADRHRGLSQLLVDLTSPGVGIQPIHDMTGAHNFNEVRFTDVFVPTEDLLGERGQGWAQVMSELALERSGPERFLSSFMVVEALTARARAGAPDEVLRAIGRLVGHVAILRRLSMSIAELLRSGEDPIVQAAMVKDLGAVLEQEIPNVARAIYALQPSPTSEDVLSSVVAVTLLNAPSFSLRGGTREILRGIIARGIGARP